MIYKREELEITKIKMSEISIVISDILYELLQVAELSDAGNLRYLSTYSAIRILRF